MYLSVRFMYFWASCPCYGSFLWTPILPRVFVLEIKLRPVYRKWIRKRKGNQSNTWNNHQLQWMLLVTFLTRFTLCVILGRKVEDWKWLLTFLLFFRFLCSSLMIIVSAWYLDFNISRLLQQLLSKLHKIQCCHEESVDFPKK